jgi:hypothetical protein
VCAFAGKRVFDESWFSAVGNGSVPRVDTQDARFSVILALSDFER